MPDESALHPEDRRVYHVFLASPGDMNPERKAVRAFFDEFNRTTAANLRLRFEVVDWENYATAGVGRAQELITEQTLNRYQESLALVIGLMGQRFGEPTGDYESGTEEEFEWALKWHRDRQIPEIKWFFRDVRKFKAPCNDAAVLEKAVAQWKRVQEFQKRFREGQPAVLYREFTSTRNFEDVLRNDLTLWLNDPSRPWATGRATQTGESIATPKQVEKRIAECFVISPIDKNDPRIAEVFDRLIKPACGQLGFRAVRADQIEGTDRKQVITEHLSAAPMAIAYLGQPVPYWNPDVMVEVGFRLATGKPLVMVGELAAPGSDGQSPTLTKLLPFYLVHKTVLELPKNPQDAKEELIKGLEVARNEESRAEWDTTHAAIECQFTNVQSDLQVTYISPQAKELFGLDDTEGIKGIDAIRERSKAGMPEQQRQEFHAEQGAILLQIQAKAIGWSQNANQFSIPTARVPIIMKDSPTGRNGKPVGHLPVIVRYSIREGVIRLRTLYLPVSNCLKYDKAKECWICDL